jgi:transcriptional/translational regulatory protein YebC/TACO1
MFDRKGVIVLDGEKITEDEVMEVALDAGAEDVVAEDGVITITTDPNDFTSVVEAVQAKHDAGLSPKEEETPESEKWATLSAAVSMVPQMTTAVDLETASKVKKLLDRLEEDDDVQAVWSTVEYPDDFDEE